MVEVLKITLSRTVNSKLEWNDNLAAIFEAKLTFNRPSSSVPFYCIFVGAVDTIFLGICFYFIYTEICFYFDLRSNVMVYEFII